jgi:hypothetical protein
MKRIVDRRGLKRYLDYLSETKRFNARVLNELEIRGLFHDGVSVEWMRPA